MRMQPLNEIMTRVIEQGEAAAVTHVDNHNDEKRGNSLKRIVLWKLDR